MNKLQITDFKKVNGSIVANLDKNYTVAKVVITLGDGAPGQVVDAEVSYAKNRVTTDLIWFANACGKVNSVLEFVPNSPGEASDIYVTISDEQVDIIKMELYLAEDVDLAKCYPLYFDKDLLKNYYLDTVTVHTSCKGYTHYTVYTSLDGKDFKRVARKLNSEPSNTSGDVYNLNGIEARIIRVLVEYNSESAVACFDRVEFTGTESGSPIYETPLVEVEDFNNSKYNINITNEDTIDAVYGIIERRVGGEYKSWFTFELKDNGGYDYFDISVKDNRIHITGNNGISLATGVNYYLKYYCNVNISQVGDRVELPAEPVLFKGTVHKETKARVRYAYNYCTLSYSMSFWGEEEWQNELDWLCLNGVNVVLDATAQEEVWRRFLTELGYPHKEIKKFIAGPGYYAWAYMANLTGFGGPVHDNWFADRTELARKNHLFMRKIGMMPILQGYSGMVPCDILNYDKNCDVIPQGTWCSFQRPAMLRTVSPCFKDYAKKFYKAQREVYGDYSRYFATDPFHEGGITLDVQPFEIAKEVLTSMLSEKNDAVWVVQSWQNNPTSELLRGIEFVGKEHGIILDLYAEKQPNYPKGNPDNSSFGYDAEFNYTPWLYCMLNNFGGRLGLHGHLDNIVGDIPKVFNNCKAVAGIGITPEASINNPVLYEFFFESVWTDKACEYKACDIKAWLKAYVMRRYGTDDENILKVWDILCDTVYKSELNMLGQGAPESILNARPALAVNAASTWGNAVIGYDKKELKKALELFMKSYDELKNTSGYYYDAVTMSLQVLSNEIQDIHERMSAAFIAKDIEKFKEYSNEFLKCASTMEKVASTSKYYLLGDWINQAKRLANGCDDFTCDRYEMNAKALVTTWGAYNQAEIGGLHDYSNRQWSGLIGDFYIKRWQMWIDNRLAELEGKPFDEDNWFAFEWEWVRTPKLYSHTPSNDNLNLLMGEYYG